MYVCICIHTLCPKKWPPKHFATAAANLHRFKWNFTHTTRRLFLSSLSNFIRIPYFVYEIFNSFKLLSQISVTDTASHSFSLWLLHLPVPAGQCPSLQCPWDGCATVSWETPDFISPRDWPLNSPDLNPVDYMGFGAFCRKESTTARSLTSII